MGALFFSGASLCGTWELSKHLPGSPGAAFGAKTVKRALNPKTNGNVRKKEQQKQLILASIGRSRPYVVQISVQAHTKYNFRGMGLPMVDIVTGPHHFLLAYPEAPKWHGVRNLRKPSHYY